MSRDPIWDDMKQVSKQKFDQDRARFLGEALEKDDGGWEKHTQYHWSRMVKGHKLDYWPSRKKWQYKGKINRGDVIAYIKRLEK